VACCGLIKKKKIDVKKECQEKKNEIQIIGLISKLNNMNKKIQQKIN